MYWVQTLSFDTVWFPIELTELFREEVAKLAGLLRQALCAGKIRRTFLNTREDGVD